MNYQEKILKKREDLYANKLKSDLDWLYGPGSVERSVAFESIKACGRVSDAIWRSCEAVKNELRLMAIRMKRKYGVNPTGDDLRFYGRALRQLAVHNASD